MKRIVSIVLCLCMLLPVLAGCEMNVTLKEGVPMKGQTAQTGNNGGVGGSTDMEEVSFDELFPSLGNATFTLDNDSTTTGEFTPGKPLTLFVTDSAGATWTLDVPADALMFGETITMIAMRDVTLGEYGALSGGVQLSPDGLNFLNPATLTVTGGGYGADSFMLQGDHNGGNVEFVYYEASSNGASATVWHFSTQYGNNAPPPIDLGRMRDRNAQRVYDAVAKYDHENPRGDYPAPPSLTFNSCPNHDNKTEKEILENYWKAFREPEWAAIQKIAAMNSGSRWNELADPKTKLPQSMGDDQWYMSAMYILFDRLKTKMSYLASDHSYQEDKYKAIAYIAQILDSGMMRTLQDACNINFTREQEANIMDSYYKELINDWAKEVWNDWMKKLVEEHDYIAAHALMEVQRFNDSVGVDGHNYMELLANALTFEVRHNIDYNGDGTIFYKMSGSTTVKMDQGASYERFGSKAGSGSYDSATAEAMAHDGPSSYDQTVKLSDFDPCINKTITAGFSVFGAASENWHETESGMNIPVTFPGMVYMGFYAYAKNNIDQDTGGFKFELPLQNMSAQAADETFFWSGEVVFSLDVILTHTPEGEVYIK